MGMRPSKFIHPLARLRSICGEAKNKPLGQKELADLVDRKMITIQKIENKKLSLSQELAHEISHQTGVLVDWLLKGDPHVSPTTSDGAPYTHEYYVSYRDHNKAYMAAINQYWKEQGSPTEDGVQKPRTLRWFIRRIMSGYPRR